MLNAEILNMVVQRKKMEAVHAEQLTEIPKCRMERDQTRAEHVELLRLIVIEPSIEILRGKAQSIMERGMARSQPGGLDDMSASSPSPSPGHGCDSAAAVAVNVQAPGQPHVAAAAYNMWGFLIDNQDLLGALGSLKLQNAGNRGDLLRQWETYLEQTRGGGHQRTRGSSSEFKSMVRDKLFPSTSFFVNSRTLMGCTDPLVRGSVHPISVLSSR